MPEGSTAYEWFEFIGHPFTAILVACLVAIYGLAMRQGMPKDKVMEICGHALQTGGDHSAGDWCGRRVQTGAG